MLLLTPKRNALSLNPLPFSAMENLFVGNSDKAPIKAYPEVKI
jgi:hypothetical protein